YGFAEGPVAGRKRDVWKHILEILGKTKRVGRSRKQAQDRVKNLFGRHVLAIGGRQACHQFRLEVRRVHIRAAIVKRKSISAIAAAKCMTVWILCKAPSS